MTSPDPRVVAARIKAETGIDVLDSSADAVAAAAAMRRAGRQVAGTFGGGLVATLALICIVLAFAPGNAAVGLRVAFGLVGVALAAGGTALLVWAWRTPAAYTELYVKRKQAQQRFFTEIGQPRPSPFAAGNWLTRKAMIAFSTPSEVRAMRAEAASRQPPPGRRRTAGSAQQPAVLRRQHAGSHLVSRVCSGQRPRAPRTRIGR